MANRRRIRLDAGAPFLFAPARIQPKAGDVASTFFAQVSRIQAGETVGPLTLAYPDYPRSSGWSLNCVIFGDTGLAGEQAAVGGADADSFALTIPATTTAAWTGGRKSFVIEVVHAVSGKKIAERGAILVLWNPRITTQEMTILAGIRAVKAGLATDGQRTITLGDGIQIRNMTPAELDSWEARYVKVVNAQIGKAGGNGGVYAIKIRTRDNG